MDEYPNNPARRRVPGGFLSLSKILIYLAVLAIAGIIYFKFYYGKEGGYSRVPEEIQIKYIPADFKAKINEEHALAILSNPYRYTREFHKLVYDFNVSLLDHVANRMDLPDSTKTLIRKEYEKHHPYLRRLYFNDFVALKDTSDSLAPLWYENESTNAVEILNEVASKYTCTLINQVLVSILKTHEGRLYVKGKQVDTPCGVALLEGLQPMIKRLSEKAAIEDFSRSKGLVEERIEKAIAELATMEVRDQKAISRQLQTKIWGFNVSSSDVEVSAISIIKVGFKLDRYFDMDLNAGSKLVTVTLPEPDILSSEVYPRVDKLDIGWLREVQTVDFNRNIDLLRKEFRRDVHESDVFERSKKRAIELMNTMLTPLITSLDRQYVLRVKFKNVNRELDEKIEDDPFENESNAANMDH